MSEAPLGRRPGEGDHEPADVLACPFDRAMVLAATPTRLERTDERLPERLIARVYAACDVAPRRHPGSKLSALRDFPHSASAV
jgi:hypothetical protein